VKAEGVSDECRAPAALSPPWHRDVTCASDLSMSSTSFADIVHDQVLQTATFEHAVKKSLALIQVVASSNPLLVFVFYITSHSTITACGVATSCCISYVSRQWEEAIFEPTSSKSLGPWDMKLT